MKNRAKYWDIFNYRLKELTDNVDTMNSNPSGASRVLLVLIPLLILTALIEYLWVKIFGVDKDKYTWPIYLKDISL